MGGKDRGSVLGRKIERPLARFPGFIRKSVKHGVPVGYVHLYWRMENIAQEERDILARPEAD